MQQVERYREAISRRVDAWQKAIFEGLINTPPDRYNAKTLEQLRVTREGQDQLRDIAAGMVEEADVVIARMKQILEARTHQEEPGAAPSELTPGRIAAAAAAVPVRAAAKPTRPATAASPAAAGGSGDSPTAGRINNTVVGNVLKAVEAARAARKAGRA